MRKLVMGIALTTLLASPAFAQSFSPSFGTGNVISPNEMMRGNVTNDMIIPSYPSVRVQPAMSEHLSGVRAEVPKAKRQKHPAHQR